MVARQDITVCLVFLVTIMVLMNFYTLLMFWKSRFDDQLSKLQNQPYGIRYNSGLSHTDGSLDPEVSSVRFRVVVHGGYKLMIPRDFPESESEYWTSLERDLLAKLEYDNALALTSNRLRNGDRRLRRAFANSSSTSFDPRTLDPAKVWKNIEGFPENEDLIRVESFSEVLQFLRNAEIKQASETRKGTQLKLELLLEGGQLAFFKPAWYPRDVLVRGDPYGGKDRHYGEIAAFYLGQLLGYKSGPIVVGRKLNLASEVLPYTTSQLNNTFYKNSNGDICFYGICYYCKISDPVCSNQGVIEGALVLLMKHKLRLYPNPWKRTYKKNQFAEWELNSSYCHNLLLDVPKSQRETFLLEMVAVAIFDFLIGNADRHHLDLFGSNIGRISGHLQNIVLLDNGKSFGDPGEDYFDILAPLYQCCIIRQELYTVLRKFRGDLGSSFDTLTKFDPLYPLLTPAHLIALDRRLKIIISTIEVCQDRVRGTAKVIL